MLLAGQAVRAVALGVVVTALTQAVLGGIGLAVSGVPYAALLTVVMIFTCLVQLGPLLVLVPSIIWLYWAGHHLGHRAAGLELRSRHHGQRYSSGAHPHGRRPANDPYPHRRHWRPDRLRHDRPVYRSGAARRLRRLYDAGCMRCRRRRKTLTSSLKSSVSWRPVASNAAGGETRLFLARILQNLLIAGNALAPRALHLAFSPVLHNNLTIERNLIDGKGPLPTISSRL